MRFAKFCIGLLILSAASLALASVSVDFEKAADFSKYKTYQWKEGTSLPNPLMQDRLEAAIDKELQAKGVKPATDQADLIVITHGKLETQQHVDVTSFGYGGYYGWGGGMATTSTTVREIPVGTILVDLVDSGTNKLVWRGSGQDIVSTKPEKNEAKINKIIPKMFKNFPPAKK